MGTHDDDRIADDRAANGSLPIITDETITRIEGAVFDEIADARRVDVRRARRRRRVWVGAASAAAVVVVAAAISPVVLGGLGGSGGGETSADAPGYSVDAGPESGGAVPEGDAYSTEEKPDAEDADDATEDAVPITREIIASGSATVEVDDIRASSDALTSLAEAAGGYVEGLEVSSAERGRIALRVPAEALEGLLADLEEVGAVVGTSLSREDVTDQAFDLRARVSTAEASVERLTELMSQSGSVGDLIEAEAALSERQAQLESYQADLDRLEDRVAMSSLQVDLTLEATAEHADPANFGDGFLAGWNGLIVTLNGVVVALGFLLPWLATLGAAGLLVWIIVRSRRRARS